VSVRPGNAYGGAFGFNITLGTLDVLGDLNAVLMLEEQEENVRVISSPRIVTLHNEKAEIRQEAEVPVTASSNAKDGTKTTRMEKIEMLLSVTPEVANNGVVQMDVTLTRGFFGGVQADGNVSKHKREAKTKVMVKSGQTAVIGGIYQNDMSQLENGVPFLKNIPIIGALFRDHNYHKDKTELLLFLTPRILSQAGSPVVAQDINDMGGIKDEGDSQLE
jgi:type IV pilus assembly protein PilQ